MKTKAFPFRLAVMGASLLALAACGPGGFDIDLRGGAGGLDTSDAVRNATASRPAPDARGVISYPGYQVAIARRGDTIDTVAQRLGTDPVALARYNAIPQSTPLRDGPLRGIGERYGPAQTVSHDGRVIRCLRSVSRIAASFNFGHGHSLFFHLFQHGSDDQGRHDSRQTRRRG